MPQNFDTNTSAPIGYYEKLQGGRQSRPPSRADKRRESASSDRPYDRNKFIIKHDCLSREVNPPTRSRSLPPRPPTRRKLLDMPTARQFSSRARSSGPPSRRDSAQKSRSTRSQRSTKSTSPVVAHFTASVKPNSTQETVEINERSPTIPTPAPRNAKSKQRDTSFKNSISDHEYLQFSLRITEDIIRNDLYTNKEMRRVFNSHLEANRGRLDMDKMTQQIDNLCKELNIPLDETQDDLTTRSQMKSKRNNLSCICGPVSKPVNAELKDCECGLARCLPFQCVQHCVTNTENVEKNSTSYSTSTNTTPTSHQTVKDKTEEEDACATSDSFQDDFTELQVYENLQSQPATPVNISSQLLHQEENDSWSSIPYYDEIDLSTHLRQSLGFFQLPLLPSLSRVTEKTEPTTSCETMDVKLEASEPNVESVSEFDPSDVLPVFENVEQEQNSAVENISSSGSDRSKKNTTFGNTVKMRLMQSNAPQHALGESKEEYIVSIEPEDSNLTGVNCSLTKEEITNSMEKVPSSAESEKVFWVLQPSGMPQQPATIDHPRVYNEKECTNSKRIVDSTSIKSIPVNDSQIKTVCSASPTYCTQSTCSGITSQHAISETKSEPVKHLSKVPIPSPRTSALEVCNASPVSFEIKPSSSFKKAATESISNNSKSVKNHCDNKENSESQIVQLLETSNIKIRGLNNREEEYILVPGPIYVPKSSIIPMKAENNQNISILAPEIVKRDIGTFSKDAMVNTDEQLSVRCDRDNTKQIQSPTSSKFEVIKEPSTPCSSNTSSYNGSVKSTQSGISNSSTLRDTASRSTTYSQVHSSAVNAVHVTSFVSNISTISSMPPQAVPISESMLMTNKVRKSIAKPPKVMKKCKDYTPASQTSENNTQIQLSDYDLTPQRDSNRSACSNNTSTMPIGDSQQFFYKDKFTILNKDALLLGDEYEIKNDFCSKKSSISSCYDNGLPYTICRFYPNISTQTRPSDFLLPSKTPLKSNNSDHQQQVSKHSEKEYGNKEYQDQQEQKAQQSILKKKQMLTLDQQAAKQQELEKRESDKELEPKEQWISSQQESEAPKDKMCRRSESDSLTKFLHTEIEGEIFKNEAEDNDEENKEAELEGYRLEKNDERRESEIDEDKDKKENETNEEENNESYDNEEELEDEDFLQSINNRAPRESIMLTIKQVTNDLEKYRKTEIPMDEFVQSRYRIPSQNRKLSIAEDLLQQQAEQKRKNSISSGISRLSEISGMGSQGKLPFIEVTNSDPQFNAENEISNDSEKTSCCGLRKGKKKMRRDLIDIVESTQKLLNINTIPDDQLFEMDPRRPTVDVGYGHDRKSLRFDYSAMEKFGRVPADKNNLRRETLDVKDFTSPYSTQQSIANVTGVESEDDILPTVRNHIVHLHTPSLPQQGKCDHTDSVASAVQFNDKVKTIDHEQHNSVIDILRPQTVSVLSVEVMDNLGQHKQTTQNDSPNMNTKS